MEVLNVSTPCFNNEYFHHEVSLFNRPHVAGAVLQTSLELSNNSLTHDLSPESLKPFHARKLQLAHHTFLTILKLHQWFKDY